jgi:hypothetical protein
MAKAITTNIHLNRTAKMTGWEYRDMHTMEGEALHLKGDVNNISTLDFLLQSQLFGQIFDTYISMCDSLDLH